MQPRRWVPIGLAVALLVAGGCSDSSAPTEPAASSTATTLEVRQDVLAEQIDPPGAVGRTLTMMRYTIAPGAELSPHIHPGIQMARIEAGALTYTIVSGTARIERGTPSGATEELTGPDETTLEVDDVVYEVDGMVHFGANDTTEPVVILATLLTESDEDLAVVVATTTTTTQP